MIARILLIFGLVALATACGGSGGSSQPTSPTSTPAPTRIIALSGVMAFGNVTVGQTKTATLTIGNTGTSTLTWSSITSSNQYFLVPSGPGSVGAGGSVNVTVTFSPSAALQPGDYTGTLTVVADHTAGVNTIGISGTGVAAPPPSPSGVFYVWGGSTYSQYLGFFSCTFCKEFASDSINNEFGTYGSQFSATSIRNQFGTYGSQFSNSSPCNQFASNPPRVYNADRSIYYGELTLNQFRGDAIKTTAVVNWLTADVCKH